MDDRRGPPEGGTHLPEPGMMQAGKGVWRELRARLGCDKSQLQKEVLAQAVTNSQALDRR